MSTEAWETFEECISSVNHLEKRRPQVRAQAAERRSHCLNEFPESLSGFGTVYRLLQSFVAS